MSGLGTLGGGWIGEHRGTLLVKGERGRGFPVIALYDWVMDTSGGKVYLVILGSNEDGHRRKRSSSNLISLELILKVSGGQESKLTLTPSSLHSRKISVDWLKALKKVSVLTCGYR